MPTPATAGQHVSPRILTAAPAPVATPTYGGLMWTPFTRTNGQTAWNAVDPNGGFFWLDTEGQLYDLPQAGRLTPAQAANPAQFSLGSAGSYFANLFQTNPLTGTLPNNAGLTPINANASAQQAAAAAAVAAQNAAATTGTGLSSTENATLAQLLDELGGGVGTAGGATGDEASIPPSAILPDDTASTTTSSLSVTDWIVIGVIASLIAGGIWFWVEHHKKKPAAAGSAAPAAGGFHL